VPLYHPPYRLFVAQGGGWSGFPARMRLLALGVLVSTLGIVVFSSIGLPTGVASVLVGLSLLPFFAAVVANAVRFRGEVVQQPGAVLYRTLRLVPPLFLVGSLAAAKVLQRADTPAASRVTVLALGFLGFVLGLRELRERARRQAGNDG
jgi:hypothetical protein